MHRVSPGLEKHSESGAVVTLAFTPDEGPGFDVQAAKRKPEDETAKNVFAPMVGRIGVGLTAAVEGPGEESNTRDRAGVGP